MFLFKKPFPSDIHNNKEEKSHNFYFIPDLKGSHKNEICH